MIDRYSRTIFRELWSDRARFDAWLRVELAVCEAMEGIGLVPKGQAAAVREATAGKVSAERILEIEAVTKHDVIAFLTHIEEIAGDPARWLHLGMTSSDVLDTSLALICREAAEHLLASTDGLLAALKKRALEHKMTATIGRSHGIHAEPTTAGVVFARWHAEVSRSRERLERAKEAISVGKIAGAVGAYGNIDPKVESIALADLGLRPETVASQIVARDRHAEFLNALAMLGTAVEQIAVGVRHWQRTEVNEAEEGFGKGQKGSSAMPHKKNPILSENVTGLARLLRGYARSGIEDVVLWHERDISHSSVERIALPDATALADFMLIRATKIITGLVVKPENMLKNLQASGGLYNSGGILLELVQKGHPRQRAYEWVQECAMAYLAGDGTFQENLKQHGEIKKSLSADEIDSLFDLTNQLKHVDHIIKRALGEA